MHNHIQTRFENNIERVNSLLSLYSLLDSLEINEKSLPRSKRDDILRAAVVLLHATFEDLVRSVLLWKLITTDDAELLNKIPFDKTKGEKAKVGLGDLIAQSEMTIEEVVHHGVSEHLDKQSFSWVGDATNALREVGVVLPKDKTRDNLMKAAMARRHAIVHQSDRAKPAKNDHGRPMKLEKSEVKRWVAAIKAYGEVLLKLAS